MKKILKFALGFAGLIGVSALAYYLLTRKTEDGNGGTGGIVGYSTYPKMIANRVQWENKYMAGGLNRDQYMEIFNFYVNFWANLANKVAFDSYQWALAKYGFTLLV